MRSVLSKETRPDTRPIPVADGWAGADMRVFTVFDLCWRTDRRTHWRMDKASYRVACPQLKIKSIGQSVHEIWAFKVWVKKVTTDSATLRKKIMNMFRSQTAYSCLSSIFLDSILFLWFSSIFFDSVLFCCIWKQNVLNQRKQNWIKENRAESKKIKLNQCK